MAFSGKNRRPSAIEGTPAALKELSLLLLMCRSAQEVLVKRVVLGDGEGEREEIYGGLSAASRPQGETAVEELVNKMEAWSGPAHAK